jgi:hypothetical protein
MSETRHLELASEPGTWQVTLRDGSVLDVTAHGYSDEKGSFVFSLLMEGQPCFEVDILRIPSELVSQIRGG